MLIIFDDNLKITSVPFFIAHYNLLSCEFEDISFSCGAAKLQMLDLSQDKTHTTDSHSTTESDFLKNLCLKTPIAWGNSVDKRWTLLDDKVSDKLHMCATLADTLSLLQESIYNDAANIFGHLQQKKEEPGFAKSTNQVFHRTYPTKEPAFGSN